MPAICRVVIQPRFGARDSCAVCAGLPCRRSRWWRPVGCRMNGILLRDTSHGSVQEIEQPRCSGEMRNNAGEKSEQPVAGQ